jgi:hypothetical protein
VLYHKTVTRAELFTQQLTNMNPFLPSQFTHPTINSSSPAENGRKSASAADIRREWDDKHCEMLRP